MKSGFYMTTNDDQISGWTEKKLQNTSQSKLAPKKIHGHCLVIHYSFLKLGETIESEKYAQQIDVKHWKLQRLQPVLVNRMGPVLHNTQPHVAKHFKC